MSTFDNEWPTRISPFPTFSQNVDNILFAQFETTSQLYNQQDPQPVDVALNVTKVTLGDHNFVALLILPILCVTGLIGNVMVCIAIWTDRRLHNVTNYFLFSLALADMLVCMIVMPLAILIEVKQGMSFCTTNAIIVRRI
jgi:hypothetical protein